LIEWSPPKVSKARRLNRVGDEKKEKFIRDMPTDLLDVIVSYLDLYDINSLVKTRHRRLANAEELWVNSASDFYAVKNKKVTWHRKVRFKNGYVN
jgi:hypothetical protein